MKRLAFVAILLASFGFADSGSLTQRGGAKGRPAQYVGAHALNWRGANSAIGPLRSNKVFYPASEPLPSRWPRDSYGMAPGALAIIAYKVPTTHVLSYVRSIPANRPVTMVFWQEPEAHLTASRFLSMFERQSRLIQSAHRPNVKIAYDASIWRYRREYPVAYGCDYVPPSRFVNYYYGDAYEANDQTLAREPQFQRWLHCTAHRHHRRGLAEYGLGGCQGAAYRARTIRSDAAYLNRNLPHLQVLSYWWDSRSPHSGTSCHTDWQFRHAAEISVWRAIERAPLGPKISPRRLLHIPVSSP